MIKLLSAAVGVLLLSSCSTAPAKRTGARPSKTTRGTVKAQDLPDPSGPAPAPAVNPGTAGTAAAEQEYRAAHEAYGRAEYDETLKRLNVFVTKYPRSSLLAQAHNLRGLSLLLTKRPDEAATAFQLAIAAAPKNANFGQYVSYNLAKSQYESGKLTEAEQTLAQIRVADLERDTRMKVHLLKGNLLLKKSLPYESAIEVLTAGKELAESGPEHPQAKELKAAFAASLDHSLGETRGTLAIENLLKDFQGSPLADLLLFRLALREQENGELAKAELHFEELLNRFPQSDYADQAQQLRRSHEPDYPVDGTAVGVLLPMKGKFAKFGARSLQGIQQAFNIFEMEKPDSKITLVIEDSGDEPEQAVRALNRLVSRHHVAAVIGPLLTKGIDQVTQRAQELKVPLISLARQEGTTGDFVIPAGLTLRLQAHELARNAIEKQGLKRFAILSPRDKVGEDFAQHFWDAVESLGGEITGFETYNPGETDFRQAVDKLAGLYYTEARGRELEELARLREENQIKKRTRKTEQYFNLKPIVDFDAVFVPDEPKIAGQVLPTFSYRDVNGMTFLGPSAWNSAEFVSRVQSVTEKALFVDAFLPESAAPSARRFTEGYRAQFSQDPTIIDALAYDAARILDQALVLAGPDRKRPDVLERIQEIRNFPGATGMISFKDGFLYRDLKVLTVKAGQIVETQ